MDIKIKSIEEPIGETVGVLPEYQPSKWESQIIITLDKLVPFGTVIKDLQQIYQTLKNRETRVRKNYLSNSNSYHYCIDELLDEPRVVHDAKEQGSSDKAIRRLLKEKYSEEDYWRFVLSTGFNRLTYGQKYQYNNSDGKVPETIKDLPEPEVFKVKLIGPTNAINFTKDVIDLLIEYSSN